MPTLNGISRSAFQCGLYEAQDVFCEIDSVDVIQLDPGWGFRFKDSWQRRLLFRGVSKSLALMNPGLRKVKLTQDYDLFVSVCQNYWDLLYINAIEGWRDRCRVKVCWIDEMWVADLAKCKHWLHVLEPFDHVFIGYSGTAGPLSKVVNRTCHWLPGAVDAKRFSPYPRVPERVIDVYNIGRRWAGIHDALYEASVRGEAFYVYDTFPGMANLEPYDYRQHREMYANTVKRSKYFLVAPGKMNQPQETVGQSEIGFRYFEGAVAGAAMIGQPPTTPGFVERFPWQDVVIPVEADGSDVLEVIAKLEAEPERVGEIQRRNATEAILRHDWLHRWKEILRMAGLEELPAMRERERQLQEAAGVLGGGAIRMSDSTSKK